MTKQVKLPDASQKTPSSNQEAFSTGYRKSRGRRNQIMVCPNANFKSNLLLTREAILYVVKPRALKYITILVCLFFTKTNNVLGWTQMCFKDSFSFS